MIASIFISTFVLIFLVGIIYVLLNRGKYETRVGFFAVIIIYFLSEITYFISFNLSAENYFNTTFALIIWYISIIARSFSIGMFASIHNFELNKDSKVRFLPMLFYVFIGGIILSLLFVPDSFSVIQKDFEYFYLFNHIELLTSIILFNFCIILFSWVIQIKGYHNFADKKLGKFNFVFILLFSLHIFLYILYLITLATFFKLLHSLVYLISIGFFLVAIINKPNLFAVITNKIYDLIIFHKSGILLYSFNFQTREEVDESLLKGSILIGISHILANLSNVEAQITHIKMKDRAVVFNFNTQLGYAALLIAKHKNDILESAVEKFMQDFSKINEENLQNLNRLIDVSKFKNAYKLVIKNFSHYLTEA
ncbi:MAG: hypothetical protein E3J90_08730 [Promethearchaeota archaeon]|nr:MAG: hypothetical protein E3J90_08730 [Candidatus Lokiarchaeota archaeon]